MDMNPSQIILITGERQTGKTTLCFNLVAALQASGINVTGVLTRHVGPNDLEAVEVAAGQQYALTLPFSPDHGGALSRFRMDPEALERSRRTLADSFPTQVFVVDEIGPLELRHGQGWDHVPTLLARDDYTVALIVVRPELLGEAIARMPASIYTVAKVTVQTRDALAVSLRDTLFEVCLCNRSMP